MRDKPSDLLGQPRPEFPSASLPARARRSASELIAISEEVHDALGRLATGQLELDRKVQDDLGRTVTALLNAARVVMPTIVEARKSGKVPFLLPGEEPPQRDVNFNEDGAHLGQVRQLADISAVHLDEEIQGKSGHMPTPETDQPEIEFREFTEEELEGIHDKEVELIGLMSQLDGLAITRQRMLNLGFSAHKTIYARRAEFTKRFSALRERLSQAAGQEMFKQKGTHGITRYDITQGFRFGGFEVWPTTEKEY